VLEAVKKALDVTVDDYDKEIEELIDAALMDMELTGINIRNRQDPRILMAVKTFCRINFKSPPDYDRLKASYDEQKAQLTMATGFTNWGDE
jgi:hypothetical protein